MSVDMMTAVMKSETARKLHSSHKFVLYLLADRANDAGLAFALVGTIARDVNMDVSTVHRALRYLERYGFISINRRPGRSSTYVIHLSRARAPSTVQGVEEADAQEEAAPEKVEIEAPKSPAAEEQPTEGEGAPSTTSESDPPIPSTSTPGTVQGVDLSTTCGSTIHTRGTTPHPYGIVPHLPLAPCNTPLAPCHPIPSLNPLREPSLNLGGPDGKKNQDTDPNRDPTPEEWERRKAETAAKVEEALRRMAVSS